VIEKNWLYGEATITWQDGDTTMIVTLATSVNVASKDVIQVKTECVADDEMAAGTVPASGGAGAVAELADIVMQPAEAMERSPEKVIGAAGGSSSSGASSSAVPAAPGPPPKRKVGGKSKKPSGAKGA
jgi:hypothetical protein